MNEEMRRQDDKALENLQHRFDRHLEIYAQNGKELAGLKAEMAGMREDIKGLFKGVVYKSEFSPVQKLVYGVVGLILVSFFGALIALILK